MSYFVIHNLTMKVYHTSSDDYAVDGDLTNFSLSNIISMCMKSFNFVCEEL